MGEQTAAPAALADVIGQNVAALRRDAGWTQDDLAGLMQKLGYPWLRSTVAAVEAGKREPRMGDIVGLCSLFQVSDGELVGRVAIPRVRLGRQAVTSSTAARQALDHGGWFHSEKTLAEMREAESPGLDEALRKASRVLGAPVGTLASIAVDLWGRSLVKEREARLGDVAGLPPRTVQARRGHVTRTLIGEMRAALAAERER